MTSAVSCAASFVEAHTQLTERETDTGFAPQWKEHGRNKEQTSRRSRPYAIKMINFSIFFFCQPFREPPDELNHHSGEHNLKVGVGFLEKEGHTGTCLLTQGSE